MQKFFKDGAEILKKTEAALGDDDPLFLEMLKMMRHVNGCREEVENLVEKGNRIESYLKCFRSMMQFNQGDACIILFY